ncbi:MAG: hypothetical protein ABIW33_07800 [Sphingomicrobium sp.]
MIPSKSLEIVTRRIGRWQGTAGLLACLMFAVVPSAANAAPIPFLLAPSSNTAVGAQSAAVFDVKLRLAAGGGLARLLLDNGVSKDDAAMAARLAAGHLGEQAAGCSALVSIARSVGTDALRVERIILTTDTAQTVIERRSGELSLTSVAATGTIGQRRA